MNHIYIPTTSPADWRRFLAEPEKQWRSGYSAKELAVSWECADGFPVVFKTLFSSAEHPALNDPELLLAIPEYQVALPGGGRASQNDLFVLARAGDGNLVTIMVEGKKEEPFGEPLGEWLRNASPGKQERLRFLCEVLGLPDALPPDLRYQLLHRTASAVLEARRFNARYALMVVQSFSPQHRWFEDFEALSNLFGVAAQRNRLAAFMELDGVELYAGWVTSTAASAEQSTGG